MSAGTDHIADATPVAAADASVSPPRVVLITGVARPLGANLAMCLARDPRIERLIGIDATSPSGVAEAMLPSRLEFVRADIRTAAPAALLIDAQVEAVVHTAVVSAADGHTGGRAGMKEQNVIGTMQLLAACQQAPELRKIVIRSSTAAYGASFRDPAVFTESTEPREIPRGGFARDVLDIEGYVRGFRRRRPDVEATVLRFAPFIGEGASTTLTHYFSQPFVPTVLGRDPRLQFVHVDDAMEILCRAVSGHHAGTYNVAGPGTITLSQAVRRAGRIAVPILETGMSALAGFAKSVGPRGFSLDQLDLFVHGRVVDTSRLIAEFGYAPRGTDAAFTDFLRAHTTGALLPREAVEAAEKVILAQIRQRRGTTAGPGLADNADTVDAAAPDADVVPPPIDGDVGSEDVWDRRVAGGLAFLRRRLTGAYEVDEFGFDRELADGVFQQALRPLYRDWFRVEVHGAKHLPEDGPGLVVANHSGTVPLDTLMLTSAVRDERRYLRLLGADLVFRMPIVSELARKSGATLACAPDAERLLGSGELVGVFPEGFKGVGKHYRDRYKLQRFGRGGFVAAALRTGTPIIPVAIVGAEETYPMLADVKPLARLLGLPYFPVTPTFPWLGPLGLVPLPSKWLIEFGEPIETAHLMDQADDPIVVFNLADQVRETIQQTLHDLLARRPDAF